MKIEKGDLVQRKAAKVPTVFEVLDVQYGLANLRISEHTLSTEEVSALQHHSPQEGSYVRDEPGTIFRVKALSPLVLYTKSGEEVRGLSLETICPVRVPTP